MIVFPNLIYKLNLWQNFNYLFGIALSISMLPLRSMCHVIVMCVWCRCWMQWFSSFMNTSSIIVAIIIMLFWGGLCIIWTSFILPHFCNISTNIEVSLIMVINCIPCIWSLLSFLLICRRRYVDMLFIWDHRLSNRVHIWTSLISYRFYSSIWICHFPYRGHLQVVCYPKTNCGKGKQSGSREHSRFQYKASTREIIRCIMPIIDTSTSNEEKKCNRKCDPTIG